ncbi:hypothetical protein CRUP_036065 [Coryphaenoides rupestris]|nr:hypothetical protein CRUP_036065 [Coryphaenoides rupestris]
MAVEMRLPIARSAARSAASLLHRQTNKDLVAPGDVITTDTGFMRFNGEVGDVIVGRITEVQQKRWKVETNSRLDSVLLLSSVNLPGGELAEVQSVYSDGALLLHTRSLKYGKLGQGVLVQISPSLIKRQKTHFHHLPCGASIILGNNGFVWLYPTPCQLEEEAGGFYTSLEPVSLSDREVISRLRNCLLALSAHKVLLYDTSVKDILKPEVMEEIVMMTQQKLIEHEG